MEEYEVISIPVSDGTERDFAIMDTFEFEGQGYLAVLPYFFQNTINIKREQ